MTLDYEASLNALTRIPLCVEHHVMIVATDVSLREPRLRGEGRASRPRAGMLGSACEDRLKTTNTEIAYEVFHSGITYEVPIPCVLENGGQLGHVRRVRL